MDVSTRMAPGQPEVTERTPSRVAGLDIAAFILALFPFPFVGAILGMVGVHEAHKVGRKAHGLSVAAIVIGWGFMAVAVIVVIVASVHNSQDPAQVFSTCIQNAIANNTPVSACNTP